VLRGGSWNNAANNVRSANRNNNTPDNRNDNIGFRCVSAPGAFLKGQVRRLYGPGASAEREIGQTCSRLDLRTPRGFNQRKMALPGVVGPEDSTLRAGPTTDHLPGSSQLPGR